MTPQWRGSGLAARTFGNLVVLRAVVAAMEGQRVGCPDPSAAAVATSAAFSPQWRGQRVGCPDLIAGPCGMGDWTRGHAAMEGQRVGCPDAVT